MSNALVLCGQWFADLALTGLLRFKLAQTAPNSAFAKLHVSAQLANAKALRLTIRTICSLKSILTTLLD